MTSDAGKKFVNNISEIQQLIENVDSAAISESGSTFKPLKELKTKLIQSLGLDEQESVLGLVAELKDIANTIRGLTTTKTSLEMVKKQMETKLALGIPATLQTKEMSEFLDNITSLSNVEKLTDLEEIERARFLISKIADKDSLASYKEADRESIRALKELFDDMNIPDSFDGPGSSVRIGKDEIEKYVARAQYAANEGSTKFQTEILEYLNRVSQSDSAAQDMVGRLKILYKEVELGSMETGKTLQSRAKRSLARIIDDLFNPILGSGVKDIKDIKYTYADGTSYHLADLYSYARSDVTLRTMQNPIIEKNLEETMEYMGKLTGLDFGTLNAFDPETLGKIGYNSAIRHVKAETGRLIGVPEIFDEAAERFEIFTAKSEAFQMAFNQSGLRPPRQAPVIIFSELAAKQAGIETGPAIDADFLNDFMTIATSKGEEEAEKLVRDSYLRRLESSGIKLPEEKAQRAAQEYIDTISKMKLLRIAQEDKRTGGMLGVELSGVAESGEELSAQAPTIVKPNFQALDEAVAAQINEQQSAVDDILRRIADIENTIADLSEQSVNTQGRLARQSSKFRTVGQVFKSFLNDNPQINNLFKGAMRNKGKILAGTAAAAGIAVFAMKKKNDVTEQGVAGPPLLPGGSPYENLPSAAVGLPDPNIVAGDQGTSYNVSFNASQEEIDEFMARAGSLSNGQIQGTMHDTLPNLGRNSYEDIAGSF